MSRRPSAWVIRRRRLTALAVLITLAALIVILVLRFTAPPPQFGGTWAGSDPLLGGKRWRITELQGDEYEVKGMSVGGAPLRRLRLDGGKLVASGTGADGTWSLAISSVSDGNQLVAEYKQSEDAAAQVVRFTRVPDD